jgi:hypothetical protein
MKKINIISFLLLILMQTAIPVSLIQLCIMGTNGKNQMGQLPLSISNLG